MRDAYLTKLLRFAPLPFERVVATCDVEIGRYAALPAGFRGTNPSIVGFGDRYLVCVRGVNYTKGEYRAAPVITVGYRYMTVNRFFIVDRDFRYERSLPGLDAAFDDVEDVKLFRHGDTLMCVGTALDPARGANARAISLLAIDADLSGARARSIPSPFDLRQEKNWAPFV